MLIREYTEADFDALRRMHARQGFGYAFPNLADPLFVSKLVVEDGDGRPVMASLARLTCEMYLLVDRQSETNAGAGKPPGEVRRGPLFCKSAARERFANFLALHR